MPSDDAYAPLWDVELWAAFQRHRIRETLEKEREVALKALEESIQQKRRDSEKYIAELNRAAYDDREAAATTLASVRERDASLITQAARLQALACELDAQFRSRIAMADATKAEAFNAERERWRAQLDTIVAEREAAVRDLTNSIEEARREAAQSAEKSAALDRERLTNLEKELDSAKETARSALHESRTLREDLDRMRSPAGVATLSNEAIAQHPSVVALAHELNALRLQFSRCQKRLRKERKRAKAAEADVDAVLTAAWVSDLSSARKDRVRPPRDSGDRWGSEDRSAGSFSDSTENSGESTAGN